MNVMITEIATAAPVDNSLGSYQNINIQPVHAYKSNATSGCSIDLGKKKKN